MGGIFMYKETRTKVRTREIVLGLILLFMFLYTLPLIKTKVNRFRTLNSLKPVGKDGVYIMKYELDYKLDSYLKTGSRNIKQLYNFIDRTTSIPFLSSDSYPVFNNKDLYDTESFKEYEECSAFSSFDTNGNVIFSRNLDIKGRHPVLALYTEPSSGYSSVSIVEIPILGCTDDNEELKVLFKHYGNRTPLLRAPYMPRDGMNEKGLAVATLNVPQQDVVIDSSKPVLGRWQVLRLLLDKASNVNEAIKLLRNYNCFDGSVHYFLSDASGNSSVIEYYDGKMIVVPTEGNFQVVTNFYLSQPDSPGKGHQRYDSAYRQLSSKNGIVEEAEAMGILSLMKEPSTAYSVIYNQGNGEVYLSFNQDYKKIFNLKLKMK
jgi:hypothetical protein